MVTIARNYIIVTLLFTLPLMSAAAESGRLAAVKLDNPRDTMRSFITAMNDYKAGIEHDDKAKQARLGDAVRCLNLQDVPIVLRSDTGEETAIYLKEVIDRVIVIDYDRIPDTNVDGTGPLLRWRLKDTEIVIARIEGADRAGEYLFSSETVARSKEFYQRVRDLPYLPGSGGGALYREPWLEQAVPDWSRGTTLGVANWQWIGLFCAILIGLVVHKITAQVVQAAKRFAGRTSFQWDDELINAVDKPVGLTAASAFWFMSIYALRFEGIPQTIMVTVVQIILSCSLIWMAYRLVDVLGLYLAELTSLTESTLDDHLVPLVRKALRIFVVIFGVLMIFQNLGFNVMSVLAGLGLGGLAFALAARDMCANLFGSLMIILDRPFNIGDWIIASGTEGTVEEIGFRSTRIRTFYNSQVSIPNALLASTSIDNMGRREYRRIKAFFGLTYDTPPEKMEGFLEGLRNIVEANPYTRKDYYHVVFSEYGEACLQVMLYCFLKVPDWATELVERQNIYLEILRLAERIGVDFAFPTQSLHIETFPGQEPVRQPHKIDADALRDGAHAFGPRGTAARPAGSGIFVPPYRAQREEVSEDR